MLDPHKLTMTFEKNIEELQKIVRSLETGALPLEESLKSFEQGVRLIRECQVALTDAEKRVELFSINAPQA